MAFKTRRIRNSLSLARERQKPKTTTTVVENPPKFPTTLVSGKPSTIKHTTARKYPYTMNAVVGTRKLRISGTSPYATMLRYTTEMNAKSTHKPSGVFNKVKSLFTRKQPKVALYQIHDNGGRPFVVEVQGKRVSVYFNSEYVKNYINEPNKHIFTTHSADKVFIGKKSPSWGSYDGLSASEADGNSILVKIGSKYVFIGQEIFEFSPVAGDSIQQYYSDIGNSDVPYPYAVGKTHVYLMLEKVAIPKKDLNMKKDAYEQYYFTKKKELENKAKKFATRTIQKRL